MRTVDAGSSRVPAEPLGSPGRSPVSTTAVVTERQRYTVAGIIRHLARQQPDHEMFVLGGERRTWAEEFDVACRVAHAALGDGVKAGDRIAFLDRNGIAYFDFFFGG